MGALLLQSGRLFWHAARAAALVARAAALVARAAMLVALWRLLWRLVVDLVDPPAVVTPARVD
jgi:hypothetical protein